MDTVAAACLERMHTSLTPPRPCPDCGASLGASPGDHRCDDERLLDFQMFGLRSEIARLMPELEAWLATPPGRFAAWLAERERTPV